MWAGWGGFGPSQPASLCPPFTSLRDVVARTRDNPN